MSLKTSWKTNQSAVPAPNNSQFGVCVESEASVGTDGCHSGQQLCCTVWGRSSGERGSWQIGGCVGCWWYPGPVGGSRSAAPLSSSLLCEKAAALPPEGNVPLLTLRWIGVGYLNIIRFSERLLLSDLWVGSAARWKHSFRRGSGAGCVWRPRLLLLGMTAATVMAVMAARFIRLTAEKWTTQWHIVFRKTERFDGLNTSMSEWMNEEHCGFIFIFFKQLLRAPVLNIYTHTHMLCMKLPTTQYKQTVNQSVLLWKASLYAL